MFNPWQIAAVFGIALSAVAAYITTYNAISKINIDIQQDPNLTQKLKVRFIITLVISCLAVVVGIFLAYWFRNSLHKVIPILGLGLAGAGILGIIYGLVSRYQTSTGQGIKVGISWVALLIFLGLGWWSSR